MYTLLTNRVPLLLTAFCLLLTVVSAQSSTATLSGTVEDENGAVIPGAVITVKNYATSLERHGTTSDSGSFSIPLLPPGEYTVLVEREGFTRVQLTNIVLNVGDQKAVQVQLKVGDVTSATVEVRSDSVLIETGGDVGTVIDRQFVQNIPLNGRSFQTLFELTPGIVMTPANTGGQFSVNGQRTNSNYVTVDGVSANTGIGITGNSVIAQTGSGQNPSYTASGTTAGLVSVDALQEFRIQTSSYAAEFGHQPGGQISLVTRSGGNDLHGTVFDYVRNEAFDANNWFANRNNRPKPPFRQHLFGGTFSGPMYFPNFGEGGKGWYSGKNRTFFFFSFEGLRLMQPKSFESNVPSLCLRGEADCPIAWQASPAYLAIVRSYPKPTGPGPESFVNCTVAASDPLCTATPDPNDPPQAGTRPTGIATFAASYSDPSRYDATALRVDHSFGKVTLFGRFSHTPSSSSTRLVGTFSNVNNSNANNTFFTAGSAWAISNAVVNDLRANYTTFDGTGSFDLDDFGGAVPLQTFGFIGRSPETTRFGIGLTGFGSINWGQVSGLKQRQFNVVDNLSMNLGDHQLKFGADFRRSNPVLGNPGLETLVTTVPQIRSGTANRYSITVRDTVVHEVAYDTVSLYAQDTWKMNRRLTLTYGLRWEFVPPPHATQGGEAVTLDGLDNPLAANHLSVAPLGTPLWETRYGSFAPRVSASYLLVDKPGRELVVRGGAGLFYDLGVGNSAQAFREWPYTASISNPIAGSSCPPPLTFPLPACALVVPALGSTPPGSLVVLDRQLELPRTYQWNFSAEQSLGSHQTVTVSYVGAAGRKLLSQSTFTGLRLAGISYPAGQTTTLDYQRNLGYSNYRALQAQFQRRLSRGFQTLVSYTFSHSRDTESQNNSGVPIEAIDPAMQYGYSAFDVRHNLTGAATYQIPSIKSNPILKAISRDWEMSVMFRSRTGFPLNVRTQVAFPPLPGTLFVSPNVVQGQPFWVDDPDAPGGRRLNHLAFSVPATGTVGDLHRNALRGFGAKQIDLSLGREFPLAEKVRLQFRGEVFNIFNWPNFADPSVQFSTSSSATNFGFSQQMLNTSLGAAGGLNGSYQIGGPRSMQFVARISF